MQQGRTVAGQLDGGPVGRSFDEEVAPKPLFGFAVRTIGDSYIIPGTAQDASGFIGQLLPANPGFLCFQALSVSAIFFHPPLVFVGAEFRPAGGIVVKQEQVLRHVSYHLSIRTALDFTLRA